MRFRGEPFKTITLTHFSFLTVELRNPPGRDFDLYRYRAGKTRPFASSRRIGRSDRLERVLAPGRYDVGVYGYRGRGRGRVQITIE